jgi:uncharacterized integral membrane protein
MTELPGPDRSPEGRRERPVASKTVAALAVAVLLIAFGASNRRQVKIDWLVFSTSTSLILVIVVSALLGALLGALAVRRRRRAG